MPWAGPRPADLPRLAAGRRDANLRAAERPGRIRVVQNGAGARDAVPRHLGARVDAGRARRCCRSRSTRSTRRTAGSSCTSTTSPATSSSSGSPLSAATRTSRTPQSAAEVIRIPHPTFDNHNGGVAAVRPRRHALSSPPATAAAAAIRSRTRRTPRRLLGKMLRIDVSTLPYRIPPSNPFAGLGRGEEIWAHRPAQSVALVVRQATEPHLHRRRRPGPVRGGRRRRRRDAPNRQLRLADHRGLRVLPERSVQQERADPAHARVRPPHRRLRGHRRLRLSRRGDPGAAGALLLLRLLRRLHPQLPPRAERPGGREGRLERARRSGACSRSAKTRTASSTPSPRAAKIYRIARQ